MESSSIYCVFCYDNDLVPGKICKFTDSQLKTAHTILNLRIKHKLDFSDTVLPTVVNNHGYHAECYKIFVALGDHYLGNEQMSKSSNSPEHPYAFHEVLVHDSPHSNSSISNDALNAINGSQDIIDDVSYACIFCGNEKKYVNDIEEHLLSCDVQEIACNIKMFANKINDSEILEKINKLYVVYYHDICRISYQYKATKNIIKLSKCKENLNVKSFYEQAYKELCNYIRKNVVKHGNFIPLNHIYTKYRDILKQISNGKINPEFGTYSAKFLEVRLKKTFTKSTKFITLFHKKTIVPTTKNITAPIPITVDEDDVLQSAEHILRFEILKLITESASNEESDNFNIENLIPGSLNSFLIDLLAGSQDKAKNDSDFLKKVESLAEEIVLAVHDTLEENDEE